MVPWLLLAHAGATLAMTGLIWLVQVVQYPLFAQVGPEHFVAYHQGHTRQITWVVLPLMVLEAGTAAALVTAPPRSVPMGWLVLGLALVILIWAVTFFHSVPRHEVLSHGFDVDAHAQLVRGNWVRTGAWSLRSALCLFLLSRYVR